jgi:SAM-dependent methyltransferase
MSHAWAHAYDVLGLHRADEALAHFGLQRIRQAGVTVQQACDLNAATGAAALILTKVGAGVLAVERDAALLRVAQSKPLLAGQPVVWALGDARTLGASDLQPFAGQCDLVLSRVGLGHVAQPEALAQLLTRIAWLLHPSGRFVGAVTCQVPPEPYDRVLRDDADYLAFERSDAPHEQGPITRRVVWFTREIELWWRDEYQWTEHVWPQQELLAALNAAGLELLELQSGAIQQHDVLVARRSTSAVNAR